MLFHIETKSRASDPSKLNRVSLSDLSRAGWKEKDLENLLASRIDFLLRDDQLMVIFQERQYQEEADILALDAKGTLYIFELKRWQGEQENLLQVIRYGQKFGQYKYEELERLFRRYVKTSSANLREYHANHFELDEGGMLSPSEFNNKQEFVVVTAGVDIETLDAIRYWKLNNLPITAMTYHVYEFDGEFLIEFHSYSPDANDYAALISNDFVVNTNVTYQPSAYREMLAENKAAAYYGRKFAVDGIRKNDRVFLYHTGVGVCAMGRALGKWEASDFQGNSGEQHVIRLRMEYKADPVSEPQKCVRASEINEAISGSYRFRQTAFGITREMADKIEQLLGEKHSVPPTP